MASDSPEAGTAAILRDATSAEHRSTENRSFIAALMSGQLDLEAYGVYLAQLAHVYAALESREPSSDEPWMLGDAALRRVPSIDADLAALGMPDWRSIRPLPATVAYAEHVRSLEGWLRPLAQHYTRYLGDLSGGQVVAAMLRRHYGATDAQLGFYRFDGIENLVQYKRAYRAGLDDLALTPLQQRELVEEARLAFRLNGAVFDALGETVGIGREPLAG